MKSEWPLFLGFIYGIKVMFRYTTSDGNNGSKVGW